MFKKASAIFFSALTLSGCQGGANYKSNVYKADDLHIQVETKLVTILAITPASIEIDNSQARKASITLGAILGGVAGALSKSDHNKELAGVGAVTGGAIGNLVSSTKLVDGVQLSYKESDKLLTSVQVGKLCEFKLGQAVSMATENDETRIQPNSECKKG